MFEGVNYRHFMLDKKNLVVTNLKASVQNIIRQKKEKDLEIENRRYVEVQQRS